jgi:hypothetical protein
VTENDELIRQDLSLIFEVIKGKLAAFFIKERAKRAAPPGANAEALADFCIAAVQGAMLMGKIKRSSRLVETMIGEALSHLRRSVLAPPAATTERAQRVSRDANRARARAKS